jgi:non-ribosomal peptide synthetase component F
MIGVRRPRANRGVLDVSEPTAGPDLARIYWRSADGAPARTLNDILHATVRMHPDAPAIDDGNVTLTYRELAAAVRAKGAELSGLGIRAGDRVGVRIPSGTAELYVTILGVLDAGAAYVPVDVDDPPERARTVFADADADVAAILTGEGEIVHRRPPTADRRPPTADRRPPTGVGDRRRGSPSSRVPVVRRPATTRG